MEKVTEERALSMLEVLPPRIWYKTINGEVFQVGEAASGNSRGFTYDTYERKGGEWFYLGEQNVHKVEESKVIMINPEY